MNTGTVKKFRNGILLLALLAVFTVGMPLSVQSGTANIRVSVASADSTTGNSSSGQAVTPVNCSFGITNLGPIFSPTCWGRTIGAIVSGVLVFIAGWVLTIAGSLFDFTLNATVLSFGTLVNSNVITAINAAWSAFRDISNIVIIAMFTFIAISTILGSHDFGAKKMVSRVLIVAVLINFSLLFTKIIIDISNFTAIQFYAAAVAQNPNFTSAVGQNSSGGGSGGGTQAQAPGIADAFMAYAGVSGYTDTRQAVSNLADSINDGNIAFLHGIFVAIVLLAAAIVLFYGSFLLISRGLLMIFLMITSSIAFATYLVPKAASSKFGWSTWWDSLLKNAIFAPLLMVLLGISLTVGNAVKAQGGTLGDLLANPTKSLDINALFGYIIVIGLLFISFKTASSFSQGITGFDYASIIPGFAYNTAAGAGTWAARGLFGGGATALANNAWLQNQAEKLGVKRPFNAAMYGAATGSWDPRSIPGAKKGAKLVGVDLGTATGKGGYQKQMADAKKKADAREEAITAFVGQPTRKERAAKGEVYDSEERVKGHEKEYSDAEKGHYDNMREGYIRGAQEEQARKQTELAAKQLEVEKAVAAGDTAGERRSRVEAAKLRQAISEQGENIKRAHEGTNKEIKNKIAQMAPMKELLSKIAEEKGLQTRLKRITDRPIQRQKDYASTIGNKFYLSFLGDKTRAKEIQMKVQKGIGKTETQKDQEKLIKVLGESLKEKPETKEEPHTETPKPSEPKSDH